MGRTGDSLDDEVPPIIGGKKPSPRGSPCREDTGWPVGEMVVVVVAVVEVVVVVAAVVAVSSK